MSAVLETPPLEDEYRWGILQVKAHRAQAVRAFELFRTQGIEPILIKGIAAAANYPDDVPRLSTDMDLAVASRKFGAAETLAKSEAAAGMAIDMHNELRHFDSLPWADLFANSRMMAVEGGDIRVLRPEDHLRVMCVHWLTDGGSSKKRLWDIYYAVDRRPDDFDWDRFLGVVPENRRRWLLCTLGLTARYLGLDLKRTPAEGADQNLPQWLIKAVEKQWNDGEKAQPLEISIYDPRVFVRQALMRFNPEPIWATIQMNGSFDAPTRLHYKVGNFFLRIPDSIRRIRETIRARTS